MWGGVGGSWVALKQGVGEVTYESGFWTEGWREQIQEGEISQLIRPL